MVIGKENGMMRGREGPKTGKAEGKRGEGHGNSNKRNFAYSTSRPAIQPCHPSSSRLHILAVLRII